MLEGVSLLAKGGEVNKRGVQPDKEGAEVD